MCIIVKEDGEHTYAKQKKIENDVSVWNARKRS